VALDPWIAELLEQVSTEWVEVPEGFAPECSIGDLALRKRTGASVLAVERGGVNTPNPGPEFVLRAGDRLLVFGGGEGIARMRGLLAGPATP
jgi:TrkA domain protein